MRPLACGAAGTMGLGPGQHLLPWAGHPVPSASRSRGGMAPNPTDATPSFSVLLLGPQDPGAPQLRPEQLQRRSCPLKGPSSPEASPQLPWQLRWQSCCPERLVSLEGVCGNRHFHAAP